MSRHKQRVADIQRQIASVLWRLWDPLNMREEEDAPTNEYDAYVGPVYRLLASGASAEAIAEHLARVESEAMGYADTHPQALLPVAAALLQLDVRLDSSEHAI